MTISTTSAKSRYAGDGSTSAFPTGFKFLDNEHVRVILRRADGSEVPWSEGSEYSLGGAGLPGGGTVQVSTSPVDHTPAVGETLVVKLAVPPRQETSLPLGGAFPSTAVEGMADLAALRDQQIEEALSRAVKFKETTALADVAFPEPEAGLAVRWNAEGDGLENAALPSWLSGPGAPGGAFGTPGDFYLDTAFGDIYEKTGEATWALRINIAGPQGATGAGVPSGGAAGQVLRKASNADHDTEWGATAAAVDSVFGRIGAVTAENGDYNAEQVSETVAAKIMTAAERTKLAGIEAGAEVNPPALEPGQKIVLTIATGYVAVTSGYHALRSENGDPIDDLDTIDASAFNDDALFILAAGDPGEVVTVKDATGNILLVAGDFVLDDAGKRLVLQKDGANLVEIARSHHEPPPVAATVTEMRAAAVDSAFATPGRTHHHPGVAKAWVRFNGNGTIAVQDSYNVGSVTDLGLGVYRVSFSTAMSNASYAIACAVQRGGVNNDCHGNYDQGNGPTTSHVTIGTAAGGTQIDPTICAVTVFGDQ